MRKFPHLPLDLKSDETAKFTGDVYMGSNCEVGKDVVIDASKSRIIIGNNCIIGSKTIIRSGNDKIIIGDNVLIGHSCEIYDSLENDTKIGDNAKIGDIALIPENS